MNELNTIHIHFNSISSNIYTNSALLSNMNYFTIPSKCVVTLILISCGFCLCVCTEELNSAEDDYAPFYELDEECINFSSATLDDVDLIKNLNLPLTRGGKCLLACMFKKIDIISADGHYQHEQCLSTIERVLEGYPRVLNRAIELVDLCSAEVANISDDEEGCEIAATIFSCVSSYIKDSEFDSGSDERK